jgi:hypothetical protein
MLKHNLASVPSYPFQKVEAEIFTPPRRDLYVASTTSLPRSSSGSAQSSAQSSSALASPAVSTSSFGGSQLSVASSSSSSFSEGRHPFPRSAGVAPINPPLPQTRPRALPAFTAPPVVPFLLLHYPIPPCTTKRSSTLAILLHPIQARQERPPSPIQSIITTDIIPTSPLPLSLPPSPLIRPPSTLPAYA